jgi:hypothetical protein
LNIPQIAYLPLFRCSLLKEKTRIIFWIRVIREIRGSIFFVHLKNLPLVVARCRTLPLAQQELPWQDRIVR